MAKRKRKRPAVWRPERVNEADLYNQVIDDEEDLMIIDQVFDWERFQRLLEPLYHDTMGRPISNPPIIMLKANIIKYRECWSDQQTRRHIQHNLLFRKFLGLGPRDPIFEKTALSDFRIRLEEAGIKQQIFFEVNQMLIELGLIEPGETIFVDGTLVEANVKPLTLTQLLGDSIQLLLRSMCEYHPQMWFELDDLHPGHYDHYIDDGREPTIMFIDPEARTTSVERLHYDAHELFYFLCDRDLDPMVRGYLEFLMRTVDQLITVEEIRDPSRRDDEKPRKKRRQLNKKAYRLLQNEGHLQIKDNADVEGPRSVSPHDLDATWGRGSGGQNCPGYRMIAMVNENGAILNYRLQPAGVPEGDPLLEMIGEMWSGFGFATNQMVGDMEFTRSSTVDLLWQNGIAVIGKIRRSDIVPDLIYDVDRGSEVVTCANGRVTKLEHRAGRKLVARFPIDDCVWCPFWDVCPGEPKSTIRRVEFAETSMAQLVNGLIDLDSIEHRLIRKRFYVAESRFAELKGSYGLRRSRHRGLEHTDTQVFFSTIVMNMRKAARVVVRDRRSAEGGRSREARGLQDRRGGPVGGLPRGPHAPLAALAA